MPGASTICPQCGQPDSFNLPPRSELAQAKPINYSLQGVGGWLHLFCIIITILTPLANLRGLDYSELTFWTIFRILIGISSFAVGISVWSVSPRALPLARIYFIAFTAFEALTLVALFALYGKDVSPLQIANRIRTIVWIIIWFAYFRKSERVRATFGTNL